MKVCVVRPGGLGGWPAGVAWAKGVEVSAGTGYVVRLGRERGIDTLVSATICAALGPFTDGR